MRYSEQQINNSLQYVEEQEGLDAYRLQASRNSRFVMKQRINGDIDVSDWGAYDHNKSRDKKKQQFPYLKTSNRQKDKAHERFVDLVNESHGNVFSKYQELPPFRIDSKEKKESPKKVDLKLPLPFSQQSSRPIYLSQAALPHIKKIVLPVRLLRREDRYKEKFGGQQFPIELAGLIGLVQKQKGAKKSMLLATARRQLRSFHSFTERNPRISLDNSTLKDCITFGK